jgi:KUP system potassium uptake protein
MVTVKYMFIVLSADDDGEGGTFALYTLLARYANIVRKNPNITGTVHMERHLTGELKPTAKNLRHVIEHNAIARNALKVVGVLGVTMVMAGKC